jgi:hypothetical protein
MPSLFRLKVKNYKVRVMGEKGAFLKYYQIRINSVPREGIKIILKIKITNLFNFGG